MAETRAERFNRLLKKALPNDVDRIDSGNWGPKGCPYVFNTRADGTQRLSITDEDSGDVVSAMGKTRDEVLDALEAKLS